MWSILHVSTGLLNTDCGEVSAPILLDRSAAFDAVNHKILPNRLRLTEFLGMQDLKKKSKTSWLQTYHKRSRQIRACRAYMRRPTKLTSWTFSLLMRVLKLQSKSTSVRDLWEYITGWPVHIYFLFRQSCSLNSSEQNYAISVLFIEEGDCLHNNTFPCILLNPYSLLLFYFIF